MLTTLGIVIGVASVIATISLSEGMRASLGQKFIHLGADSLTIRSYTPVSEALKGFRSRLTIADLHLVEHKIKGINSIAPVLRSDTATHIKYEQASVFSSLLGVTHKYKNVSQYYVSSGRFLVPNDSSKRRRICIIGETVRDDLGLPKNPIGLFIEINNEWFKVVGLLEPKGKLFGFDQDDITLIPFDVMQSIQGNQVDTDVQIQIKVSNVEKIKETQKRIELLLRSNRSSTSNAVDDFRVETAEQLTSTVNGLIDTITITVSGIVGISLLVGGIGIMNIMLVSVTERTREIGICMAIGARRVHILLQFMVEAMLLSFVGGLIGVVLGYGMGAFISLNIPSFPPASIPGWAVIVSLTFSTVIGLVFGIIPAAKAANLDPIEALRYD